MAEEVLHPALAALPAVSTGILDICSLVSLAIFLQGYSAIWIAVVSTIGHYWLTKYKYIQKRVKGIYVLSLVSSRAQKPRLLPQSSAFFPKEYALKQLIAGGAAQNQC